MSPQRLDRSRLNLTTANIRHSVRSDVPPIGGDTGARARDIRRFGPGSSGDDACVDVEDWASAPDLDHCPAREVCLIAVGVGREVHTSGAAIPEFVAAGQPSVVRAAERELGISGEICELVP